MKALRIIPTCRSKLLLCLAVREVEPRAANTIIQAGPSQTTCWRPHDGKANLGSMVPNDSIRLRDPSTLSNKQIVAKLRDKTNQDKSTNGCVKPMLTLSESTLIKLRCVRLKAPCRSPPRHSTSERGERTSIDNIEVCATWRFTCTRGDKNTAQRSVCKTSNSLRQNCRMR